jgi:hypothetical protein
MKKNQRGEITVTLLGIAIVSALLIGIAVPSFRPFKNMFGKGDESAVGKKASFSTQVEKIKPKVFKMKDGEVVVVNDVELSYNTGTDQNVPKPTLGEKIGSFFFGLTSWMIIGIVVSLAFLGGTPIIWFWNRARIFKNTLKNTVAAIRGADEDTYQKLKPLLAAKQDKVDKVVVDKIKAELH